MIEDWETDFVEIRDVDIKENGVRENLKYQDMIYKCIYYVSYIYVTQKIFYIVYSKQHAIKSGKLIANK